MSNAKARGAQAQNGQIERKLTDKNTMVSITGAHNDMVKMFDI
ncbi:hypothetical protein [Vibrio cidicii]|nr:hypothetical protein [Vibrio cidicii]